MTSTYIPNTKKVAYTKDGKPVVMYRIKDEIGKESWARSRFESIEAAQAAESAGEQLFDEVRINEEKLKGLDGRARQSYLRNFRKNKKYQQELADRGIEAVERAVEARQMPWSDRMMLLGGHETMKLGAGAADIYDKTKRFFTDDQQEAERLTNRIDQRERDQAFQDDVFREIDEYTTGGGLARSLPYMVTGIGAGPATAKVGGKIVNTVGDVTKHVGKTTRSVTGRAVERVAKQRGPHGAVARRVKKEWMDPLNRRAMRKTQQIPEIDPYRQGAMSRILGDTALGGVEGLVHYDMNPLEGMIASMAGSAGGQAMKPALSRAPDFYEPDERRLVEWAKDKGFKFLPGSERGLHSAHMFEEGLRSEKAWTDIVHEMDRSNNRVMTRTALNAAGLPNQTSVTTDALQKHMDDLRSQYKALESNTTGQFDRNNMLAIRNQINNLKKSVSKTDQKAGNEAEAIFKEMLKASKVGRSRRGRYTKSTFDGSKYQGLRQKLSSKLDTAYTQGDRTTSDILTTMRKELDEALGRGLDAEQIGLGVLKNNPTSAQWRDLNERYAMSKMLMHHGMGKHGQIDLDRLGSHLLSTDPERLILEQGGRIQDLQRLVKVRDITRHLPGNANRTASIAKNPQKISAFQAFLHTPLAGAKLFSPISQTYMKLYQKGIPSTTGLLGMNLDNNRLWNAGQMNRAVAMGSMLHPSLMIGAADTVRDTYNWMLDNDVPEEELFDFGEAVRGRLLSK